MNYLYEFRKFISSQYLNTGLKLTLCTLIPCLIFQYFGVLEQFIAFPLGTLLIGLIDSPGPVTRRRNALIIGMISCLTVALTTGLMFHYPSFIFLQIIIYGMFFSLIGVYGNRAANIGLISILIFIFNIDDHLTQGKIHENGFYMTAGGMWYFMVFMVLNKLRPYVLIQQILGENLVDLGKFLRTKSKFYFENPQYNALFNEMMKQQVTLREHQESLREILFKTREMVKESTNKSRILMLMFLDSIDLFERIMDSQQDYTYLQKAFGNTKILKLFGTYIRFLSKELENIGLAIQEGRISRPEKDLEEALISCQIAYEKFREQQLTPENMEDFIMLSEIMNSMKDITARIRKLHLATTFNVSLIENSQPAVNYEQFLPREEYHPRILLDNLSLKSTHFRHSIRLTLALLAGYASSLFFEIGHGYWILLTIITILKPAFSITRQRNIKRLLGTFLGAIAGFAIIYTIEDQTILFVIMMITMMLAYSFMRIEYFVACFNLTIYVLISFHFLNNESMGDVLSDRVLDTFIGSIIAWIISAYVLPLWENAQINQYLKEVVLTNHRYFQAVTGAFNAANIDINTLKLYRKDAIIALANLSDNFQRMMSEPKKQQIKMEEYHQFVATTHMLTSHIAALSSYAQKWHGHPETFQFEPVIRQINHQFMCVENMLEQKPVLYEEEVFKLSPNQQLAERLALRKKEMFESKLYHDHSEEADRLSEMKTINGLFELISNIIRNEYRIAEKIVT